MYVHPNPALTHQARPNNISLFSHFFFIFTLSLFLSSLTSFPINSFFPVIEFLSSSIKTINNFTNSEILIEIIEILIINQSTTITMMTIYNQLTIPKREQNENHEIENKLISFVVILSVITHSSNRSSLFLSAVSLLKELCKFIIRALYVYTCKI